MRIVTLAWCLLASIAPAQELTAKSLDRWIEYLKPSASEAAWRAIPWRATLGEALREARAADKPVLLWAMNGHPLACV